MKRFFLFSAACLISFAAFAQKPVVSVGNAKTIVMKGKMGQDLKGNEAPALPINISRSEKTAPLFDNEMEVGHTYYDLQSNSELSNRFYHYTDGSMAATWTGGMEATAFADRGSFYNYFDGNAWTIDPANVTRIENARRGWPSYAPDGKGGEYIVSHAAGIDLYHRAVKGTGAWEQLAYPISSDANTWPRICVNPETGTVHVLECEQRTVASGYENYIYYSRSKDGGKTWAPQGETFSEIQDNYSVVGYAADDYIWATPRNGVIAFGLFSSTSDAIIMKSYDDGETWERTIIWQHPIPQFNYYTMTMPDTCMTPVGGASIVIDEEGMCHAFFGVGMIKFSDDMDGSYNYWPFWGNMCYWNEDMDTYRGFRGLAMSEDYDTYQEQLVCEKPICYGFCFNGDASATNEGGIEVAASYKTQGPAKFVSAEMVGPNRIIVAVSSWDERRSTPEGFVITQVYLCSYTYNDEEERWRLDENWITDPNMAGFQCGWTSGGEPVEWPYSGWFRMNNHYLHEYDECVYPQVVAQYSLDDRANFYVFYNYDVLAGVALDGDPQTEYIDNSIMMYYNDRQFNGGQIPENHDYDYLGIDNPIAEAAQMSVYPNPASDMVNILIEGNANVTIYNVLGQKIESFVCNGSKSFSVASYKAGVYFINADNGSTTLTSKLIVK